jgi:hypothetical protein
MVWRFFGLFKKQDHYAVNMKKVKFLFQFYTHFSLLDIYKCPKSVFESKIWKKVCIFYFTQSTHLLYLIVFNLSPFYLRIQVRKGGALIHNGFVRAEPLLFIGRMTNISHVSEHIFKKVMDECFSISGFF